MIPIMLAVTCSGHRPSGARSAKRPVDIYILFSSRQGSADMFHDTGRSDRIFVIQSKGGGLVVYDA